MNRRDLLRMAVLGAGGIFVPKFGRWFRVLHPPMPLTIYGDGIHDDTAALKAAFNGEPVIWRNQVIQPTEPVYLVGGVFRLSQPLVVEPRPPRPIAIMQSILNFEMSDRGLPALAYPRSLGRPHVRRG